MNVDKVSYYWGYKQYKNLKAEYFDDIIFLPFEFTKIPVPRDYDEILKRFYGEDYMIPQKLKADHQLDGDMIVDPERPYQELLKEM